MAYGQIGMIQASARVFQVVHSLRVPLPPQTQQSAGPESIFTHYDKVDEESCRCLDHSNLAVRHRDQSLVYQLVCERVSGLTLHDVTLGKLIGHGDGGHHVCAQVNAEDGDCAKWEWDVC